MVKAPPPRLRALPRRTGALPPGDAAIKATFIPPSGTDPLIVPIEGKDGSKKPLVKLPPASAPPGNRAARARKAATPSARRRRVVVTAVGIASRTLAAD